MADAVEAARQDMDQEPADELVGGQAHDLHPFTALGAVVFPAERHDALVGTDQAMVGDGDAVRVPAEIGQHGFGSAEGRFGIDDPVGFAQRREMGREGVWVCQFPQITKEVQLAGLVQPHQPFEEQAPEQP